MNNAPTSPLLTAHERAGARLTDFAGWQMPLRFTSDLAEHEAVRERAGIFDLSHMGQIEVHGPQASDLIDRSFVGVSSTMEHGRAKYTMMVNSDGRILDDLIIYRLKDDEYLVIPNGVNRILVGDELISRGEGLQATVTDRTLHRAIIALQGPMSADALQQFIDVDLDAMKYYRCQGANVTVEGVRIPILLGRTGYTGEDGFELYLPAPDAELVWEALGAVDGIDRCGLAARDSLRLEAGMPLYGNELSDSVTPYDVGLGRMVNLNHEFVGRDALSQHAAASSTTLIGLRGEGRRAARAGSGVLAADVAIGEVTSGILAPTLGHPIALARVDRDLEPGAEVSVDVRGRHIPMTVVQLPFYKRPKSK